ncbi:hypothetical protein C7B62_01650 [Pleurocapsa sp. CCALA 161]|uniref:glycosyltransferase family 39 protein n=1 Tax=Pleurocapsa sp. CCALA 161 TaxID=2107688 RepID=UPI000D05F853|nr:hypothetical protein [Pleurocapsa sp. CCALA 161]PSB12550.1 hypothetical protein C7B62_01650 [Pleurocapsa sp. CCALA 161]
MPYQHYWLLLLWITIGTCLRFIHLETLPPWTDESATLVFSLGNSFYDVPLNQFIGGQTLLEPLQLNPQAGIGDVIRLLQTESTHPPFYFVLTHLWLKLFPPVNGLVSIWAARSLSALLGVLAIPAIFYFSRFAFRSLVGGQIAAAVMAISPFGIFLSTQARHYTLVILIIIASLACYVCAVRAIKRQKIISFGLVTIWIVVNCLGIATHYFFVLSLMAMAIAIAQLMWLQWRQDRAVLTQPYWRQLYLVALGSLSGCLVWLPTILADRNSAPTEWIYASNAAEKWLEPIGRFLLWLMSIVILLPSSVYNASLGIFIVSGLLTLIFWWRNLPRITLGLKLQRQDPQQQDAISALSKYFLAAIALFFSITYSLGMDLTLAGRFQFVYFPVVIALIGASLVPFWQEDSSKFTFPEQKLATFPSNSSKKIVITFLSIGLLSGAIANLNLGYLQNHRPDIMTQKIIKSSTARIAIATSYKHHGQTGRMIGIAWGLKSLKNIDSPLFFLAQDNNAQSSAAILTQQLSKIKRPVDLWLINFPAEIDLTTQNCVADSQSDGVLGQHDYELYRCLN